MANINTDTDFDDVIENMTDEEREHTITDIIHKLFIIASYHNHRKALNGREKGEEVKPSDTPTVSKKGALDAV